LRLDDLVRVARLAHFEQLAAADDRDDAMLVERFGLLVDGRVGLAEVLAAFRVADDAVFHADCFQHGNGDFTRESAFFFPITILRADGDRGAFRSFHRRSERSKRRTDHDVHIGVVLNQRQQFLNQSGRFVLVFVHLPVAGKDVSSHLWKSFQEV
jgi:hypothetical protein